MAIFAPAIQLITHTTPIEQDLLNTYASPSREHLLGTDELGRDTLTRLVYGARVSLGVGFLAVSVALAIGGVVGLCAGFYGGWLDDVLMRVVDVVLAIPAIFLYILMAILFRPNAITLALIIASLSWAFLARLVRAEVLSLRSRDYVLAARSIGARDTRILSRHVLPNCLQIVIVAASLGIGQVVLIEAALDFLGLGIQEPTPELGRHALQRRGLLHALGVAGGAPGPDDLPDRHRLQRARERAPGRLRPKASRPRCVGRPGAEGPGRGGIRIGNGRSKRACEYCEPV